MKVLLAVFALLASAAATPVDPCSEGETVGNLIRVDIEGCERPPCILVKGDTIDFTIEFEAGQASRTLEPDVWGLIAGIPIPFEGIPQDACAALVEGRCPFADGERLVYSEGFEVLSIYPAIEVRVRWVLKDEFADWQVCFEFDVEIVNAKKQPRSPRKFLY